MKPSDIIQELYDRYRDKGNTSQDASINAIIQYLDEQYEQNKPCEHKSAYQVESTVGDDVYYNVCNGCGVLFITKADYK